jgi:phosphatidylserine/phosphatidylglycerophosphate/cardiolipin synthase-like enzyme
MRTNDSTLVDSICTGSGTARYSGRRSHATGQGARVFRSCCLLLLACVLFAGCATVPKEYPRTPSTAFQGYLDTSVGQLFEEAAQRHPGESGFAIIRHGRQAFTDRIALVDLAEKTLDAQYYIWEADATGRVLAEHLMQAADRGVRVRLLVDDINLGGRDAMVERPYTESDLRATRTTVRDWLAENPYPYPLDQDVAALRSELSSIRDQFIWAPGRIVWNDPAAIEQGIQAGVIFKAFDKKIQTLQKELLIESAYFVVRDRALEIAKQLTDRGVRIRVLTNSLASNDVVAAHAGYAKRRKGLLEAGVELYEYRPDSMVGKTRAWRGESKAALHTKAVVFDRESVFIGSFNLDLRSADINTEAGLYVESPELAEQVIAYMDEGVRPENSYRVMLDQDGDLYWVTEVDGAEARYYEEPQTTFGQRFMSGLIMILPIEQQL